MRTIIIRFVKHLSLDKYFCSLKECDKIIKCFSPLHPWTWLFCWHRPPENERDKNSAKYLQIIIIVIQACVVDIDKREIWKWYKCLYVISRLSPLTLSPLVPHSLTSVNSVPANRNISHLMHNSFPRKLPENINLTGMGIWRRGVCMHVDVSLIFV